MRSVEKGTRARTQTCAKSAHIPSPNANRPSPASMRDWIRLKHVPFRQRSSNPSYSPVVSRRASDSRGTKAAGADAAPFGDGAQEPHEPQALLVLRAARSI